MREWGVVQSMLCCTGISFFSNQFDLFAVFIIIIGYGFGYQDDDQYTIYCKYGWYSE